MRLVKIFVLVSFIISFSYSCSFADIFDDLASLEKDKYVHFSAGVVISHISYPFFKKFQEDSKKAMFYSFSLTLLICTGKELYDIRTTGFDVSDLFAGVIGGSSLFLIRF